MDIDKEELKNETKETVNKVKDTLKNVDINQEARETKGFLTEMLVNPFGKVSKVASGEEEGFKKAVVLLIINMVAAVVIALISAFKYSYGTVVSKLMDLVMAAVNPVLAIIIPAIIILLMNKSNKKPLTTIIATLVIANVPSIVASVIRIISALFSRLTIVTSPISTTLGLISTILEFMGMRILFGEEKETFITKFAIIQVITALILYIV